MAQKTIGMGLSALALFAFAAASWTFYPELKRYLRIRRM